MGWLRRQVIPRRAGLRVYLAVSATFSAAGVWPADAQDDQRWSVTECAQVIESSDPSRYDRMRFVCPGLHRPGTADFKIKLGDVLLHQYGDRRMAALQYQSAAEQGDPQGKDRLAELNSMPPEAPKQPQTQESRYCANGTTEQRIGCSQRLNTARLTCMFAGGDTNACIARVMQGDQR